MRPGWIRLATRVAAVLALASFSGAFAAEGGVPADAFDVLRLLDGSWTGTWKGEEGAEVDFELLADGSMLLETITLGGGSTMATTYYPDGDDLRATHYCSMGNQPKYVTTTVSTADCDGCELSLRFEHTGEITNPRPDGNHTFAIDFRVVDRDHVVVTYHTLWDGERLSSAAALKRRGTDS